MALADLGSALRTVQRTGLLRPVGPRKLAGVRRALKRWGSTPAGALAVSATMHPDDVFVIDERGSFTRDEMHRRSNALANGLLAEGVRGGHTVGVLTRNHRGFVDVTVALGKLGAKVLYLNTGFAGPQLREVVERERPSALIYDEEFHDVVAAGSDVSLRYLSWVEDPDSNRLGTTTTDDLIAAFPDSDPPPPADVGETIILTSGTTGTPKGAQRESETGAKPGISMIERIPYRPGDVMLISAPLFHSWGFVGLSVAMTLNSSIVLQRRFDPEQVLAGIEAHRASVLTAVPVMLQRILELPPEVIERYDTSSLRIVALSGSAIPTAVVQRWMDTFGDNIYSLYGSTEVGGVAIATPEDLRDDPTTAGRPTLWTDVRILDDEGRQVPDGEVGRIFVKGSLLFGGYTDGRNKEIIDGFMSSGDTGRFDAAGRLVIEGRDDDMIVSGGENVFPLEVEDLLVAHPDIADAAVIGVPDDDFGQRLAAFVVVRGPATLDADTVRSYVHDNLARFKAPRDVTFVDEIPRNATGKILKRELEARGATTS